MALAITAAVAGSTAAAMYLDAKYAIRKDVTALLHMKVIGMREAQATKNKRIALYYSFEDNVKIYGDNECIWSREGCYSWNETYQRVNQYGQWFLKLGVKPKDLVALYLHNSPDFMFAWMGLQSIGAAAAMINYNLSGNALIHCLKIAKANYLLIDMDPAFQARADETTPALLAEPGLQLQRINMDEKTFADIHATDSSRPDNSYRDPVKGDWPFALVYTSGTTGLPKGGIFNVSRGFSLHAGLAYTVPEDRFYDCMPFYHGTGGLAALTCLMKGYTLCIGKRFSSSRFWDEVRDSRATWITYVGETARYLLAAPPSPRDKDHCVRAMQGNGLRPDVWLKFRERFGVIDVFEFFNSTEGVFGVANFSKGDFTATAVGWHGGIVRQLTKNTFIPVRVDQDTGAIARNPETGFAYREPYEKGGEIIVKVASERAFPGYLNNPEATAKKFERNVFKKGDLYYRSGDALRRTKDGLWFFQDRLGDTYRWKGENVSTTEVAEVMGHYPGIVEANVYGVLLPNHDGRAGCAALYIDPAHKKDFDFAGLLKYMNAKLPKYAVPVFLRLVKEMTPIHNNKQNKVPLREEGVHPEKVLAGDEIWFAPSGHDTYKPFTRDNWMEVSEGRAML